MTTLFVLCLGVHLACALAATGLFWTAACAPKGGPFHRRVGRAFSLAIYATAVTGGMLAIAGLLAPGWGHRADTTLAAARHAEWQTMWLVLYVLLIIVVPVQHGLAVVAAGPNPARVRSRAHAALNIASMLGTLALLSATVIWQRWLFLIVMPIGLIVGLRNINYASRPTSTSSDWQREHLTSLITAGITLHTAFFVFGTSRSLGWQMTGVAALAPWIVPALVGVPVIAWLRRRSR